MYKIIPVILIISVLAVSGCLTESRLPTSEDLSGLGYPVENTEIKDEYNEIEDYDYEKNFFLSDNRQISFFKKDYWNENEAVDRFDYEIVFMESLYEKRNITVIECEGAGDGYGCYKSPDDVIYWGIYRMRYSMVIIRIWGEGFSVGDLDRIAELTEKKFI